MWRDACCACTTQVASLALLQGGLKSRSAVVYRQGGGFAAQKLPLDAAPPPPGAMNPAPTVAFEEFLCQRSQGCFKAVNHTGFCSGHRGVKRNHDDDGTGAAKKRKAESKRKSAKAAKNAAAAAAAAALLPVGPPPPPEGAPAPPAALHCTTGPARSL